MNLASHDFSPTMTNLSCFCLTLRSASTAKGWKIVIIRTNTKATFLLNGSLVVDSSELTKGIGYPICRITVTIVRIAGVVFHMPETGTMKGCRINWLNPNLKQAYAMSQIQMSGISSAWTYFGLVVWVLILVCTPSGLWRTVFLYFPTRSSRSSEECCPSARFANPSINRVWFEMTLKTEYSGLLAIELMSVVILIQSAQLGRENETFIEHLSYRGQGGSYLQSEVL